MTRVLVTGFEPFGIHDPNPSALIAEELGGVVLPVSYARAGGVLRDALAERDPELVICFGLADGEQAISVERFALNLDDAGAIDNDGVRSSDVIDPGGPVAYGSTLPVDEIVAALQEEGIAAKASRDAGGYLCNHIFYVLMGALGPGTKGGFVHVPELDVFPLETQIRAARTIVAVAST
jgi:pyroglutamyl-peptidase